MKQVIRWALFTLLVVFAQACSVGELSAPAPLTLAENLPSIGPASTCGDRGFRIDLLDAIGAVPDGTLEDQREQLRDWIWTATLGRHAQRHLAGDGEALAPLSAQPILRDDALSQALESSTGSARAALLKDGDVVVMVERASKDVMDAEVLEAIDQQSFYLGRTPGLAWIYEYEFLLESGRVEVCPGGRLDRMRIEAASRGYRRARLGSPADMRRFLSDGVDLLSAQCTAYGLEVTGRRRPRSRRAHVTVEQIAALTPGPRMDGGEAAFSLHPSGVVESAVEGLDQVAAALADPVSLANLLHSWGEREATPGELAGALNRLSGATFKRAREHVRALRDRVARASDQEVRRLLVPPEGTTGSQGELLARALAGAVERRATLHCAHYSGRLRGSAAGMTFFYTDLLMKLWAFDWRNAAPEGSIKGFESIVNHIEPPASCGGDALPESRIWLDVDGEQYARAPLGGARFAPVATRIFVRGRQVGATSEQEEGEPHARWLRFVGWWNAHYKDVAEWESQYEVLNQLMKWSVVVHSAAATGAPSCLRFLDDVSVPNDHRFDQWVQEAPGLRWRGPVDLVDGPQEQTECLPTFRSEAYRSCGMDVQLHGGVRGATAAGVLAKPVVGSGAGVLAGLWVAAGLGISGLEAIPDVVEPDRVKLRQVRRRAGALKDVDLERRADGVKLRAKVETPAGQKSVAARDYEKSLELRDKALSGSERVNGALRSELKVYDLEAAEMRLVVNRAPVEEAGAAFNGLRRAGEELEDALTKGHLAQAERIVEEAARGIASSRELRSLRDRIEKVRVAHVRAGLETTRLDQMTMKLAIADRSQLTGAHLRAQARAISSWEGARYAPPDYPVQAGLPPAVHPRGKLLAPSEKFVTRIVDESLTVGTPEKLVAGDRVLELAPAASNASRVVDQVGSPLRLLGAAGYSVAVVLPCDDDRWDAPPCHEIERSDLDREIYRIDKFLEEMRVSACDGDGDGKLSSSEERTCFLPRHRTRSSKGAGAAP